MARTNTGRRFPDKGHVRILYLFAAFCGGYATAILGIDSEWLKDFFKELNTYVKAIGGLPMLVFLFTVIKWLLDRKKNGK